MARFGEEDPRWIVQDREDGANVNGWHWVEKNYFGEYRRRRKRTLYVYMYVLVFTYTVIKSSVSPA